MAVDGLLSTDPSKNSLQVVPLTTPPGLTTYLAQVIIADYQNTITNFETAEGLGDINQTLVDDLITRLDDTAPYISYAGTSDAGAPVASFETILAQHADNLFPTTSPPAPIAPKAAARIATNNQEFVQYALISMGAKDTANKYVNSAVNGAALTAHTFTSQDALMTGNLAAISTDINAWGFELCNTGTLFDFKKLDNLGTPQAIIEALMRGNMLGTISDELTAQGLDIVTLTKAINDNPELTLTPMVQKRCYLALQQVNGDKLIDILAALGFLTGGIVTLADLLDLTLVFPTTYDTLTAPKVTLTPPPPFTLQNIYTNAGNITDHFSDVVAPLSAVIPDAIAIGNFVFTCSLSQVTGIRNSSPEAIGSAASQIEDQAGLDNTGVLTRALPTATTDNIKASMGGGSAPNTSFYLSDFLGAPANISNTTGYDVLNTHLPIVQAGGGYTGLALVLQIMREVLGGIDTARVEFTFINSPDDYQIEILVGNPAAGTYNDGVDYDYTAALNALLIELDTAVTNYIAAYPTDHTAMMDAYENLYGAVVAGIKQLWDSNVRFNITHVPGYETSDLSNEPSASFNNPAVDGILAQKSSTLAFAENLGQYGKLVDTGNIASILEAMVQDTLGGDAIIAAMREGRNKDKLGTAGVKGDNEISDKPQ